MSIFRIDFGKFAGKSPEQLMFSANGYWYLRRFILEQIDFSNERRHALISRVEDLVTFLGEDPRIAVSCSKCGEMATRIHGSSNEGGWTFKNFYCNWCRPERVEKQQLFALRFSTILSNRFKTRADQSQFAMKMRQACGMPKRIMKKNAFAFFYPKG